MTSLPETSPNQYTSSPLKTISYSSSVFRLGWGEATRSSIPSRTEHSRIAHQSTLLKAHRSERLDGLLSGATNAEMTTGEFWQREGIDLGCSGAQFGELFFQVAKIKSHGTRKFSDILNKNEFRNTELTVTMP